MSNDLKPCRDAFEHWFSDEGKSPRAVERNGDCYKLMQAHAAWQAWQAAWNHRAPTLTESLARNLLDPEMYGHAVTAEIRNAARRALGIPTQEPEHG